VLSLNPFKKSIWMSEEKPEEEHMRRKEKDFLQKQTEHYNKSCVYCSQTRIILTNEVRQRLQLVLHLISNLKQIRGMREAWAGEASEFS
jgi:hypothetical protein